MAAVYITCSVKVCVCVCFHTSIHSVLYNSKCVCMEGEGEGEDEFASDNGCNRRIRPSFSAQIAGLQ